MTTDGFFEIRLGVYATGEDVARLADACAQLLNDQAMPHSLALARQDEPDNAMPLAEDLPEQWRIQHPGEDPGLRAIHEIRIGVHTTRPHMDSLRGALTRLICPDPDHESPCAIPWAASFLS